MPNGAQTVDVQQQGSQPKSGKSSDLQTRLKELEGLFQAQVKASYKVAEKNFQEKISDLQKSGMSPTYLKFFAEHMYKDEVQKRVGPILNSYRLAVTHLTMGEQVKAFESESNKITQYFAKLKAKYQEHKLKGLLNKAQTLGVVTPDVLNQYAEMVQKGSPRLFSPLSSLIKCAIKSYDRSSPLKAITKYQAEAGAKAAATA